MHKATIAAITLSSLTLAACADLDPVATSASSLASPPDLVVYGRGDIVPQRQLVDLGPPAGLGGTVIDGDPHISARVDFADGDRLGGVFQATRGTVLIHFPFTEHATILNGSVALTDETGARRVLEPGDSYLIRQGSDILWEVQGARVQKSFFNRVEPADAPGPMIIYPRGGAVAQDALVSFGPPSALGAEVIEGDPQITGRVDLATPAISGGVIQTTRGEMRVDFTFTGHATVTRGRLELTDARGCAHVLSPGDSYLVREGAFIGWEVDGHRTQQSFFHLVP